MLCTNGAAPGKKPSKRSATTNGTAAIASTPPGRRDQLRGLGPIVGRRGAIAGVVGELVVGQRPAFEIPGQRPRDTTVALIEPIDQSSAVDRGRDRADDARIAERGERVGSDRGEQLHGGVERQAERRVFGLLLAQRLDRVIAEREVGAVKFRC